MENNNTLCKENNILDWCFMKDKLREILKKTLCPECGYNLPQVGVEGCFCDNFNQATDQIIKLFKESLPNEKYEQMGTDYYRLKGFNQCLKKIKKQWGEDD